MAVSPYYQSLRQPEYNALATYMDSWVGERGKMNAQLRANADVGEDPDRLLQLEQTLADKLGRLQEAKQQGDTAKQVQLIKNTSELKQEVIKGKVALAVEDARSRSERAKLRSEESRSRRETARAEQIAQTEVRDKVGDLLARAMNQAKSLGGDDAHNTVDQAIAAALDGVGAANAGIGDPRRDEAAFLAWKAAGGGSGTPSEAANYIAGKYFPRGEDPAAYRARTHGGYAQTESRVEDQYITQGMGAQQNPAYFKEAWDWEGPATVGTETGHSTRTSGTPADGGGRGERRTRTTIGDGNVTTTLDLAESGDPEATAQLSELVEDAIAEQRAMLADIRKRREAALTRRKTGGLPTANWLIDNPNRYTDKPSLPTMDEAARAAVKGEPPKVTSVTIPRVDEPESYRGGRDRLTYTGQQVGGVIGRAASTPTSGVTVMPVGAAIGVRKGPLEDEMVDDDWVTQTALEVQKAKQ